VVGIPVETFKPPANVTFVSMSPTTGRLVPDGMPGGIRECFISGTEPKRYEGERR
jgi:penicillin-binding protein 1A